MIQAAKDTKQGTKHFMVHTDPGHGWLECPRVMLTEYGIDRKVSGFSFQHKDCVYLEEDCDMGLLLNALESRGITFETHSDYQEDSPVRNYANYEPETVPAKTPEPVKAPVKTPAKAKKKAKTDPLKGKHVAYGPRTRCVAQAASTDETRFILNGVYLDGGTVVATNGRMLLFADVETVDKDELPADMVKAPVKDKTILPTVALAAAWKSRKVHKTVTVLNNPIVAAADIVSTDLGVSSKTEYKPIEGNYPNYKQVIPEKQKQKAEFTLSGVMLADLVKACKALEAGKKGLASSGAMVDFSIDADKEALSQHHPITITIRSSKNGEVKGVVMPCRKM